MLRWLFLILLAPLWLPWRGLRALLARRPFPATIAISLRGELPDLPPPRGLVQRLRPGPSGPALAPVLRLVKRASEDPRVERLLLRIDDLRCGLGRAEELREALAAAVRRGKQVVAYAEHFHLSAYWVALGASRIVSAPTASLDVTGIAMNFTLVKGLLSRAGVEAQLLARGQYKSYRETFTEEAISEANREMMQSLVESLHEALLDRLCEARGLDRGAARAALDEGPHRAEEAEARGLIDERRYWDEVVEQCGGERRIGSARAYLGRLARRRVWPRRPTRIGLLSIAGTIAAGFDQPGPRGKRATGHRSVRRALRGALKSPRVAAVLVRVESPGGSALASDLIWRELSRAAQQKPMVVSMGNVAASGGYYASGLPNVPIWANPTTLTGSIGVVGGKLQVTALMEKLGVRSEAVASGPRANFHSLTEPWGAAELEKLGRDMDALYWDFVGKMAEARGVAKERLHEVAQGRVWTGAQASKNGLVDHLGGFERALASLASQLGVTDESRLALVELATPRGPLGLPRPEPDPTAWLPRPAGELLRALLDLQPGEPEGILALEPALLRPPR